MGFSGQYVFGRSERPLLEAPVFDAIRPPWGDGACELWPRPGGWQTLQLRAEQWGSEELAALVEWTGAPACFAAIFDSDVADVVGLCPDGREWQTVLGLEIAAEMGIGQLDTHDTHDTLELLGTPEYAQACAARQAELEEAVPACARAAIAWASAAGVATAAQQSAIEAVLRAHEVFVEEGFIALIDALGFPPAVDPDEESEE
ncbi:hypothetical protein KDL01_14165 [Actinospica durhamensis]|uniref:Uncharacterized protein n=1 Tax=Actinospica durhamensis TaxID=1508375 RepID=A0A941ITJ4_9ACTN|nr:hypothetical protein [Actinospica durhamensis]MBR7834416.1 hypothetical protein [Actinospica durhamensis]